MTPRADPARDPVIQAVRLALGMSDGLPMVRDWDGVLRAAVAERCAPLAWVRCGTDIARSAPPNVTAGFRSYFAANSRRTEVALQASQATATALEPMGVYPILLKGPPLAARLYGDSAARVCSDLDWFVPAPMRATVHDTMVRTGWTHIEGDAGGEVCYGRKTPTGHTYIEVHSSLLHSRYSYLPLPEPSAKAVVIDGIRVLAHDDALLVGYLAAHLATHRFAPLAWLVDLLELSASLDRSARAESVHAAERAGLGRYLTWALARSALLRRAAEGDRNAARRLGLRDGGRVEPHPMWRHIALAPGVANMAYAAWSWIAPRWVTGQRASVFSVTMSRVARHWRDALPRRHAVV